MEKSLKDIKQEEAFKAWIDSGRKGTCLCITGFGKNKLAIMASSELNSDAKILFLAETTSREKDLRDELKKWNYNGAPIEFMCYQSAYKLKEQHYDLIIGDEIDTALTPVYSAFFFNNTYDRILCITATLDKRDKVDDSENSISKLDLLNKFAPVCYTYTTDDGQRDETSRKLNIYKIYHKLDNINQRAVTVGTKAKPIITSEELGYKICDNKFKQAMFAPEHIKTFLIRNASAKRADLLYNLPSKIVEVKKLLDNLDSKTILFGNSLDSLLKITKNTISSKYTDKQNEKIRDSFERNKINLIGSFKKLKRGANLGGLDNCVIMSYYSKERDFVQQIGRLRYNSKYGNVFIFVTKNTQEIVWFNRMFENITSFNITEFQNVEECINYLKSKELCKI